MPGEEWTIGWRRDWGFEDVDCYWKWLDMALLIGVRPAEGQTSASAAV
jgi:tRNA (cmo5U34)-methyltransferase